MSNKPEWLKAIIGVAVVLPIFVGFAQVSGWLHELWFVCLLIAVVPLRFFGVLDKGFSRRRQELPRATEEIHPVP